MFTFYVPFHTTFPTKMASLHNSQSSLSQHDLLVYVCECVLKNAMSVFNYVTLHEEVFFFFCWNIYILFTVCDLH